MMWNQFNTGAVPGISCELVEIKGHNGDTIHAYQAKPTGAGPHPGVVLIHHLPGWDELYLEFARRFAQHGYNTICPDLYCRAGHGSPDDVAAQIRSAGGVSDAQVVGDMVGAQQYLKAQGATKVGLLGSCSGGRHAFVTACSSDGWDAVVELWGGRVVQDELTEKQPVSPITLTGNLKAPILGLFGNDDQSPPPAQVDQHEAELKAKGKNYEFHRYDGAGHAFFYYDRPAYRQQQAVDGWAKIFTFFEKNLG